MRAIRIDEYGQDSKLTMYDLPDPVAKAGEVVIRNYASGLNHIDLVLRQGELPPPMQPDAPVTPGVEGAGVVEQVGDGVEGFAPGDRVMWFGALGDGGYADRVCINASYVARIGSGLSFEAAAGVPVAYMTAYHMLFNLGGAKKGDWVLVHAAGGGVGLAILDLARIHGIRVIATGSSAKREPILELGAQVFVNYQTDDLAEKVKAATDGTGVALSLNPVGGSSIATDLELLAPLGTLILYGFLAGLPTARLDETLVAHFTNSPAIRASDVYTLYRADPGAFGKNLRALADLASSARIAPKIHTVPAAEAETAHQQLAAKSHAGKIVLRWPAQ